jgi:hypothetical protein
MLVLSECGLGYMFNSKGELKMKIKISKSQWEQVGKKSGWIKEAIVNSLSENSSINKDELAKKIDISTALIKSILLDPNKDQYQKRQKVLEIMEQNRDIFPEKS